MGHLDVPEILIAIGLVACIAWALYNWRVGTGLRPVPAAPRATRTFSNPPRG